MDIVFGLFVLRIFVDQVKHQIRIPLSDDSTKSLKHITKRRVELSHQGLMQFVTSTDIIIWKWLGMVKFRSGSFATHIIKITSQCYLSDPNFHDFPCGRGCTSCLVRPTTLNLMEYQWVKCKFTRFYPSNWRLQAFLLLASAKCLLINPRSPCSWGI